MTTVNIGVQQYPSLLGRSPLWRQNLSSLITRANSSTQKNRQGLFHPLIFFSTLILPE